MRFTAEVTKTNELGILNRGDHAEITVNENLKNDYAGNLVDICPVGALTSKDFRFKQRVWFLNEVYTTCIGCEVGCSVKISENKTGAYRVKPVFDEAVNGHWMCDDGRKIYKHVSAPGRIREEFNETEITDKMKGKKSKFILSTCLTNQEYDHFFSSLKGHKVDVALYSLPNVGPEFDGILKRGNKNPNGFGAKKAFEAHGFDHSHTGLEKLLNSLSHNDAVFVVIPEIIYTEDHLKTLFSKIHKAGLKIALTPSATIISLHDFDHQLPVPTFLEKNGEITNFQGTKRTLRSGLNYGDATKDIAYYAKWVNV